jgi:3-polyprenyl-4-hydroxybenzoate decarboxylase
MARDLRGFIKLLEERGQLRRIPALVDPDLEIAEISNRMLQAGGPALLFENVKGASFPVAMKLDGNRGTGLLGNEYGASSGVGDSGEKAGNATTAKAAEEDFPSRRVRQDFV